MDNNKEIQELREKIKQLEKDQEQSQIDKYAYLVGKCFHRATTSWEKVTAINRVDPNEFQGDEINFDCISIYYDECEGKYSNDCIISSNSWGDIYDYDIERQEISPEKFSDIFENAVKFIRSKI